MVFIPFRWIVAFAAVAACAAQGDILHLRDGTRYQGQFVGQSATEVEFRIQLGNGRSSVLRRFPLARVKSVEKGPIGDQSHAPQASIVIENPPADAPDVLQMLREAFELLDDRDSPAALRAMQKAVTAAGPDALADLERKTRVDRGRPLPELMAATRIALSSDARTRNGFDVRGATAYEMPALGALLEGSQSDSLRELISGRSLSAWVAAPTQYAELTPDARMLVEKARRAAAIVSTRLRIDPRVRSAGAPRAALVKLRDDLAALATHVSTLDGFTALSAVPTPDDDPTLLEAQRLTELAAEAAAAATQPASRPADEEAPATQPATDDGLPEPPRPPPDRPER